MPWVQGLPPCQERKSIICIDRHVFHEWFMTNLLRGPCIVRVLQQFSKNGCGEWVIMKNCSDRRDGTNGFTETVTHVEGWQRTSTYVYRRFCLNWSTDAACQAWYWWDEIEAQVSGVAGRNYIGNRIWKKHGWQWARSVLVTTACILASLPPSGENVHTIIESTTSWRRPWGSRPRREPSSRSFVLCIDIILQLHLVEIFIHI